MYKPTLTVRRFSSGFVRARARPVLRLRGRNTPLDFDYLVRPLSSPGDEAGEGIVPWGPSVRVRCTVDQLPGKSQVSNRDAFSLTCNDRRGASHVALYWGETDVLMGVGVLEPSWDRGGGGFQSLFFGPGELEMTMS